MAEVAQNATAFWWRDARMNIFYLTSWPAIEGPGLAASGMAYLAEAQAALAPYIPLQASCEFAGLCFLTALLHACLYENCICSFCCELPCCRWHYWLSFANAASVPKPPG